MLLRSTRRTLAPLLLVAGMNIATPAAAQTGTFDHTDFTEMLRANVNAAGLVDYVAFAGSDAFRRYLARLASADVSALSRDEQLALWINAYNAYTVALINREDRPASDPPHQSHPGDRARQAVEHPLREGGRKDVYAR